jgi:hypothetical protein
MFCSLDDNPYPYQTQLEKMQILLDKKEDADDEEVQRIMGNTVAALYSVPTAIFCFLRACAPIPEIEVCKSVSKNYSVFSILCLIWKEK